MMHLNESSYPPTPPLCATIWLTYMVILICCCAAVLTLRAASKAFNKKI